RNDCGLAKSERGHSKPSRCRARLRDPVPARARPGARRAPRESRLHPIRSPPMSPTPELQTLMDGLVFGEQPRWHEDRLWFSDWGTQEVIAVDLDGNSEVVLHGPSFPLCVDWLPDGRLLLVSARDGLLLRLEPEGLLVTHGDLKAAS